MDNAVVGVNPLGELVKNLFYVYQKPIELSWDGTKFGTPNVKDDFFITHADRKHEKWWLPIPCVHPGGLSDKSRKHLNEKRDCANQIHKAEMAINSSVVA
ncbi:hypothetical protein JHK87_043148 [Glycine soja]|nr:hypothetical protein JHK87_043148 [Glycine soja]